MFILSLRCAARARLRPIRLRTPLPSAPLHDAVPYEAPTLRPFARAPPSR